MAGGWARDGAVQDQIDADIEDALTGLRARAAIGPSAVECDDCGDDIPEARRRAVPGVRRCVTCQSQADGSRRVASGYNRRAPKGSQMR